MISRQYSFGADKTVWISQAVFLIKGHNLNTRLKKTKKRNKLINQDIRSSLCLAFFKPNLSEKFNIVLRSMHTQPVKCVLKF